jgi:23S rRNA pseudouridine2605 synthase
MLDAIGHPVSSLRRTAFAGIELEGLPAGSHRVLLPGEVKALRKRVSGKVKKLTTKPRRRSGAKKPETPVKKPQSSPAQSPVARRIDRRWTS